MRLKLLLKSLQKYTYAAHLKDTDFDVRGQYDGRGKYDVVCGPQHSSRVCDTSDLLDLEWPLRWERVANAMGEISTMWFVDRRTQAVCDTSDLLDLEWPMRWESNSLGHFPVQVLDIVAVEDNLSCRLRGSRVYYGL
ncbi:hypothetical protein J6590_026008 [Homalodisca vitripennis]|nr:hypothetical protein J6590_026008 [Homalodisca vitripennis]